MCCHTVMALPRIDAHCWVVRNHIIIDPWFHEYTIIALIRGTTHERIYKEAPLDTQRSLEEIFMRWYRITNETLVDVPIQYGECYRNAILEIYLHGGELRIGSLGFRRADGSVWYEYGSDSYSDVHDFIK